MRFGLFLGVFGDGYISFLMNLVMVDPALSFTVAMSPWMIKLTLPLLRIMWLKVMPPSSLNFAAIAGD